MLTCGISTFINFLFLIYPVCSIDITDTLSDTTPNKFYNDVLIEKEFLPDDLVYNEDAKLNFIELTTKYGYKTETHSVVTEDNYILTLFRIPLSDKCCGATKKLPVILMHGGTESADIFVLPGPGVALPYNLAEKCYDIWLPNSRGTPYSRNHTTLNPDKDKEFWNFSYDEQGRYDMPAIIDYVIKVMKSEKCQDIRVNIIGHALGSTSFLVLASTRPEYNKKINLAICLGAFAWSSHIFSPLLQIAAKNTQALEELAELYGLYEAFGTNQNHEILIQFFCQFLPDTLCAGIIFALNGYNPNTMDRKTVAALYGHFPTSTSVKLLADVGRLIQCDQFSAFNNEADTKIIKVCGDETDEYEVHKITTPVVLIRGQNDWLSADKDVDKLMSKLPNCVENYVMPDKKFSHFDFVLDNAVFPIIVNYLEKYK